MPFNSFQDFDFSRWAPLVAPGSESESLLRKALPVEAICDFHFARYSGAYFSDLHPVEAAPGSVKNLGPVAKAETDAFLSRVVDIYGDEIFARDANRRPDRGALRDLMEFAGQEGLFSTMNAVGASLDRQPEALASPVLSVIVRTILRHGFNAASRGRSESQFPAWAGMWTGLSARHREEALRTPSFWSSLFESPAGTLPNSQVLADSANDLVFLSQLGFFCEDMRPMLSGRVLAPKAFSAFSAGLAAQAQIIDKFTHQTGPFLLQMDRFQAWLPMTAPHWAQIADACAAVEAQGDTCSILRAVVESVQLRDTVFTVSTDSMRAGNEASRDNRRAGVEAASPSRAPRL